MADPLEKESPIMASMMFADRAYLILSRVSRVLTWSVIISSCVVALVALYVTRSFLPIYTLPWVITIPLGVVVFIVLAPITVYYGLMARRMLKAWVQKFTTFSYVVRFETSLLRGNTPQERLMNQLLEGIPELGNPLKELFAENPAALKDFLNVKTYGAKAEETFDVCITKEQIKVAGKAADRLRKAVRRRGVILAKRFDKRDLVDEHDLRTIRYNVLQIPGIAGVLPFTQTKIGRILMVSTSSFTQSAKNFVEDSGNWVGGRSFDLVEEGPKGYLVVSAIT